MLKSIWEFIKRLFGAQTIANLAVYEVLKNNQRLAERVLYMCNALLAAIGNQTINDLKSVSDAVTHYTLLEKFSDEERLVLRPVLDTVVAQFAEIAKESTKLPLEQVAEAAKYITSIRDTAKIAAYGK